MSSWLSALPTRVPDGQLSVPLRPLSASSDTLWRTTNDRFDYLFKKYQAVICKRYQEATVRDLPVPDGASGQPGRQPGGVGVNGGECGVGKFGY